jgi:hypothetical protein
MNLNHARVPAFDVHVQSHFQDSVSMLAWYGEVVPLVQVSILPHRDWTERNLPFDQSHDMPNRGQDSSLKVTSDFAD